MTEVMTEVPESGTKLRIDADRSFERPTGDSVLRIWGQTPDGAQVLDAAYVECNAKEADLIGHVLRQGATPAPSTVDTIAQEVLATFGSKLSGRDAHQIATIAAKAQWLAAANRLGISGEQEAERTVNELAERFERASAKAQTPPFMGGGNGETDPRKRSEVTGARH